MAEVTLAQFVADNRDPVAVAAQARMRGDDTLIAVAQQRELRENDLVGQVLGFWLTAIRTDLTLGSTAAMRQNLGWLVRLRAGHALPFDDRMVLRMFDDISAEIDARLGSDALRGEYHAYRETVTDLILEAFPHAVESTP